MANYPKVEAKHPHRNLIAATILSSLSPCLMAENLQVEDYLSLSLENLLDTTVSSVSKKQEDIHNAAAAVYVISSEQIRRSGFQKLPDVLSMVPGLQVARVDANTWVISARGFNDVAANKLLVLQDGRTLYNPVYSGVYWDAQNYPLQDIERIEVIRGPGAVFWGSNAVNGVINIITKQAKDTQSVKLSTSVAENAHDEVSFRYGFPLDGDGQARIYLNATHNDSNDLSNSSQDAHDGGQTLQAGFRLDSQFAAYDWTLQGDIYDNKHDQLISGLASLSSPVQVTQADRIDANGWNLLSRWEHNYSNQHGEAHSRLQTYVDYNKRDEDVLNLEYRTLDVDWLNRQYLTPKHELSWGAGYRHIWDKYENSFRISVLPTKSNYYIVNAFIQDQISLTPDLHLSIGTKVEKHKQYSAEFQPSARLHWSLSDTQSFWAAISRAVRMPSRFERSGHITSALIPIPVAPPPAPPILMPVTIQGSEAFEPEKVTTYEAGYRTQLGEHLSIDAALFYNDYDQLISYETTGFNTTFGNKLEGRSYGGELSAVWRAKEWWQLALGYGYVELDTSPQSDSLDTVSAAVIEGNSARSQLTLSSWMDLTNNWSLDLFARYISDIKQSQPYTDNSGVDGYTTLNAHLSWQVNKDVNLSFTGQNLLDRKRLEYVGPSYMPPTDIERAFYCKLEVSF